MRTPRLLSELNGALVEIDFKLIQRLAHTLKSSLRIFQAHGIEALAEEVGKSGNRKGATAV